MLRHLRSPLSPLSPRSFASPSRVLSLRSRLGRFTALSVPILAAACAVGCGAHTDDVGQTSSDLAPDTLVGHWDVLGSEIDGASRAGTIDLTATSLDVSFGDYSLHFKDDPKKPSTTWQERPDPWRVITTIIPTTHAKAAVDTGIVPLALGGAWTLKDAHRPNAACTAQLETDGFATHCDDVKIQPDFNDYYTAHPYPSSAWNNWPYWYGTPPEVAAWYAAYERFIRNEIVPSPNGEMVGTRIKALASSFGQLGGEWEVAGTGGVSCNVTISGQTLTSTCAGIAGYYNEADANGTLTMHFTRGFASGTSSKGIELTARRAGR